MKIKGYHYIKKEYRRYFVYRFWDRVEKKEGCWIWKGVIDKGNGYGLFRPHQRARNRLAHRVSWYLANGPIQNGLYVCHKCDTRLCVNPDHLFLGTAKDNIRDCSNKGRIQHGEKHYLSKLKEKDVVEIRKQHKNGVLTSIISKRYKISKTNVLCIVKNKTWKHIPQ